MSILKSNKIKTYEFSYEGYTLAKADMNIQNALDKYNYIRFGIVLGLTLTGLYFIANPLSIIAFKTTNAMMSEVAFKMISTGL